MKKDTENKKDRSIRPAVVFVIIFGLIVAILVAIPLVRHRQFVRYMTDLSSMTSRAGVKEMVVCRADGEEFTIDSDAAYALYGKLVCSETIKKVKPDETLAAEGVTLTYGLLGAEVTLAPAQYQDEQALYVEYHSRTLDYTYIAPHLDYADMYRTAQNGRLP